MISVIIPVYNVEAYIEECVNSVLKQSYQDWECILVDDGSTDASGKLCDAFAEKDSRIRVIHQKNQGVSVARNNGINSAKGEYVYFIDGDDKIVTLALERFLNIAVENNSDMVLGHMAHFTDNEEPIPFQYVVKNSWICDKTGKNAFVEIHKRMSLLMMGARGLYRRKFILNNKLYFRKDISCSEDQEWVVRLFEVAEHVNSNENPDYLYREGRCGSLMNDIKLYKISDTLEVYDSWYSKSVSNCKDPFYICLYQVMVKRLWEFYFKYPDRIDKDDLREFCCMMDKRRSYSKKIPKGVKKNLHMIVMGSIKSKTICALCSIWKKIHD